MLGSGPPFPSCSAHPMTPILLPSLAWVRGQQHQTFCYSSNYKSSHGNIRWAKVKSVTFLSQVMVFGLSRRNPFFYRRSLLPNRRREFSCDISAPPVQPSQVQNVSIVSPRLSFEGDDEVYSFTVIWSPPEFSNGELEEFEIRVLVSQAMEDEFFLPESVLVRKM